MHDLDFAMKTTERFVILAILRVEKRWAKVKTSAIAYSFDHFRTLSNTDIPPSWSYHTARIRGVASQKVMEGQDAPRNTQNHS